MLVVSLVTVQPAVLTALAQESGPAQYEVAGVSGAILRAQADGASTALTIVPSGTVVVQDGPDVVTSGVLWRQVRTQDGTVGYLPAGLLLPVQGSAPDPAPGGTPVDASAASQAAQVTQPTALPTTAGPSSGTLPQPGSTGAASSQSVGGAPATPTPAPALTPASATPASSPAPDSGLPAPRVTVERRRGQDMAIAHLPTAPAPDGKTMGAGRIVVAFKSSASQAGRSAAHQAAGAISTAQVGLPGAVVAQVAPANVAQALAAYRARPDVAWAEPDYVRHATAVTNDPSFGSQWGPQKIGAPIAWDVTPGQSSTRIAILDCGVYTESSHYQAPDGLFGHPDLRGKVILEANFSDATTGTDDYCDHGTMMAGIAGAATNNGVGIAGIGFSASLLNGKVLNDAGEGYDSWVASGIVWAADNGANVISMSLGGDAVCSQTFQAAIDYAWNKGAAIVAAAGNGGLDGVGDPAPEAPGSCQHVIPVGAIDQSDARASFSNYGLAVPLAAPGVNVLSTDYIGTYNLVSGTSPATPHVAGVAALLKSTANGATNAAIVQRLFQTAAPIVGTGSVWAYGRVDAAAAVGPASCAPRPKVTVTATPDGSALNVQVGVAGVGNAVRFLQVGGSTGAASNAVVTFPGTTSEAQGITSYVLSNVAAAASFQVKRQTAGSAATLGFTVVDGCGSWKSFVGGGAGAGF